LKAECAVQEAVCRSFQPLACCISIAAAQGLTGGLHCSKSINCTSAQDTQVCPKMGKVSPKGTHVQQANTVVLSPLHGVI